MLSHVHPNYTNMLSCWRVPKTLDYPGQHPESSLVKSSQQKTMDFDPRRERKLDNSPGATLTGPQLNFIWKGGVDLYARNC